VTDRVVLLVEDNRDDEELTRLAFTENHIVNKVVVARDGAEALDYLFARGAHAGRRPDQDPEVVLLDLNLPKLSGLDVLKAIRAAPSTALLPVVVLTSSKEQEDIMRSYQLGANAYVRKPVDFGEFADAVKQLGLFWFLLNRTPAQ